MVLARGRFIRENTKEASSLPLITMARLVLWKNRGKTSLSIWGHTAGRISECVAGFAELVISQTVPRPSSTDGLCLFRGTKRVFTSILYLHGNDNIHQVSTQPVRTYSLGRFPAGELNDGM